MSGTESTMWERCCTQETWWVSAKVEWRLGEPGSPSGSVIEFSKSLNLSQGRYDPCCLVKEICIKNTLEYRPFIIHLSLLLLFEGELWLSSLSSKLKLNKKVSWSFTLISYLVLMSFKDRDTSYNDWACLRHLLL